MAGVSAFPADTKINRIKDLVVNELAEDISKNIHSSQSQSDTLSSRSDRTDFTDFTDASGGEAPPRQGSGSRFTKGEDTSDGSDKTSSSFQGNPLYPNMAKYAKYFVKEEDASSSEVHSPIKPRYKPSIRAERHRVGYSSSFQHRRRRVVVEPRRGLDDTADLVRQARYGSAPHVGRESSSTASSSSSSDIFRNVPQSSEELSGSSNVGSRMNTDYNTTHNHRHHQPTSSEEFIDDEFGTATASMPSLSKTRRDYAAGTDPGAAYTSLRNTFSEPKVNYSKETSDTTSKASSGFSVNGERSWRSPQDEQAFGKPDSRSAPSGDSTQGIPYTSFKDKQSPYCSNAHEKPKTSLPTHRENIVTSSNEDEKDSPRVSGIREPTRSRLRATPRPHSDYSNDRTSYSFVDVNPEATLKGVNSKTYAADARSSAARSPRLERVRRNFQKTPSTENHTECKNDSFRQQIPVASEENTGWRNEFSSHEKMQDEYITRTKPDDEKMPNNFLKAEMPTFHKSASFTSNIWQEKGNRSDGEFSNVHRPQKGRRGLLRRNRNSASSTNLKQFDFSIKFELRKKKRLRKDSWRDQNGNGSFEDGKSEEESELEQRNAFNERILNMRMKKEAYDYIMSDFRNGNLGSTENLNDSFSDMVDNEDNEGEPVEFQIPSDTVDAALVEDSAGKSDNNLVNSDLSQGKLENDLKSVDVATVATKPPEPEEVGHNLKEMIESMRTKYQATDVMDGEGNETEPVTLQPSWCEGICPKWNFQKMEFTIPTSIAITSKGCTVVADYGNSCLEFFDSDGNYEHKIEGIKPFSIVANKLDQIIVGDRKGKAIRIFDEYGADVSQWEAGLFSWISGIAVLANGNVAVYDRDRCKVGVYSSGGEKINEFASYGVNDSQLCMADFLTADGKNRIIVADSGNHCLKIFDSNGNFITKVGSRGIDDGCLEWPKGVCVDSMDNIIVADSQNNRVSMFSPCGQFVQHLVTTTPSPYSVCFSSLTKRLGVTHYALTGFSQYDVYQCLQ